MNRHSTPRAVVAVSAVLVTGALAAPLAAQQPFTVEDVLSPAYPHTLVSARSADRLAWIEYEEGRRNVWTAAPPDFEPVRLTAYPRDDGVDLSDVQISDDGSVVVYIRGHRPNRQGWIANPTSDPAGVERAVWAVRTDGGEPWKVAEAWNAALSPDGRWIAYDHDGQIYRAPVDPDAGPPPARGEATPLFRVWGENEDPVWSPDHAARGARRRIAFESDRDDHSFIGVYDTDARRVTWLTPGVDRDMDPTWSPDHASRDHASRGAPRRQVAFLRRPGEPFGRRAERDRSLPDSAYPEGLLDARFAGGHSLEIWVADAATGEGRRIWHDPAGDEDVWDEIRDVHWVGDRILFQAEADGWRHYYAIPADPPGDGGFREPVLLTPGEGIAEQIAFSGDHAARDHAARGAPPAAGSTTPPTPATSTAATSGGCRWTGAPRTPNGSQSARRSRRTRPCWPAATGWPCSTPPGSCPSRWRWCRRRAASRG